MTIMTNRREKKTNNKKIGKKYWKKNTVNAQKQY